MSRLVLITVLMLATACSSREQSYLTLAEARKDHLFERGWLPDVLPPSARNIEVSTNLDLNTATGSFCFKTADATDFYSRLTPNAASALSTQDWRELAARFEQMGYRTYTISAEQSNWLFMCEGPTSGCVHCFWMLWNDG